MAAVTPAEEQALEAEEAPEWARKYPPLFVFAIAVLLAVAVLPSALNLPQTNPQETLEYAPVPPEEDDDTPPDGNVSALGLGSSSGISGEGASGGDGPGGGPTDDIGAGRNPSTKRCVGNPPRQTEDPLAPPCVPYFQGNNFGATYQGVTRDEIRILVYLEGGITYVTASDQANRNSPTGKCFDLAREPDPNTPEHLTTRAVRGWQRYFNDRFQTYGRQAHMYVCYSNRSGSPEVRRADAAEHFVTIKPFAVVSEVTEGGEEAYLEAMADKGVLNFGSYGGRTEKFFQAFPKLIWGYRPSVEQQVGNFVNYLCTKVVPHPVAIAGDANGDGLPDNGKPRKIGMLYTSDDGEPGLRLAAKMVKDGIKKCGGEVAQEAIFGECCVAQDQSNNDKSAQDMARFRQEGITTIVWTGGIQGQYGRAAKAINYEPEWIVMGDGITDAAYPIVLSQHNNAFHNHAIVVTPQTYQPALEQQRCYQAYREADPNMGRSDLVYTCSYYDSFFQLFTGIQVAGPKLGPTNVDKGFHAIPQKPSGEPEVPACFYLPGDYTCVKDGAAFIWDANTQPPGDSRPGCWRAIQAGARYLTGKWPGGNVNAQLGGNMPCSGYNQNVRFNIG